MHYSEYLILFFIRINKNSVSVKAFFRLHDVHDKITAHWPLKRLASDKVDAWEQKSPF